MKVPAYTKFVTIDFQSKQVHAIILTNIKDNVQYVIVIALMMNFIIFQNVNTLQRIIFFSKDIIKIQYQNIKRADESSFE